MRSTLLLAVLLGCAAASAQTPPDQVLLKDYRPKSIFRIPETHVEKARFPVIDMHSHDDFALPRDTKIWDRA